MRKYNYWISKEIEFLVKNYENGTKDYLMLNLSQHNWIAIRAKAEKLGLKRMIFWTKEEEKILIENYCNEKKEDLLLKLHRRSPNSIKSKAKSLGLKRNRQKPKLAVDEDFFKTWTKEMAWTFGLWTADGNMSKLGNYISFSSNDQDMLEIVKSNLKS